MNDNFKHSKGEKTKDWELQQLKRRAYFLQSNLWGDFQRRLGKEVYTLSGEKWSCLLIKHKTPLGNYLFAPYGPTLDSKQSLRGCVNYLKSFARKEKTGWLTIEPMLPVGGSLVLRDGLLGLGAKKVRNREPDLTRIVNLDLPADELLARISQSTRSLIRKNQREKNLSFQTSTNPADIKQFTTMLNQVSNRNKVFFFSDEYFQKQAEVLMPPGMLRLELALMNNQPIASALIHDYGEQSTYTYAASLPEARQTSASALLLWQALFNAKARGIKRMDLFGIAPDNAPQSHPWYGFSSFKKKFGGDVVSFAGTWDIPLNSRYKVYRAARRLRARR